MTSLTPTDLAILAKADAHDALGGYTVEFVSRGLAALRDSGLVTVVESGDVYRVRITEEGRAHA